MGFWSDTKRCLSATGSALSQGVAILAEGASELEKSAHRLSIETTIWSLERQRKDMGERWFSPSNATKSEELLCAYHRLIKEFPENAGTQTKIELARLESDRRALKVKNQVQSIVALNNLVKSTQYKLPIDAIVARERLKKLLGELLGVAREHEHGELLKRARTRIDELEGEIAQLQLQRRTFESAFYASGKIKSKISRYDGKLNGSYEQWYENGNLQWNLCFSAGDIKGRATNWLEDGSLFLTADIDRGNGKFQVYLPKQQPMFTAGYHGLSRAIAFDSGPLEGFNLELTELPSFFKKLIIMISNPRLLLFFWRARKHGEESIFVGQFAVAMNGMERAFDEMRLIKESG